MAKQIEEALKEAVEQVEEETAVSARVKQLLARKRNLKRSKYNHLRPRRK